MTTEMTFHFIQEHIRTFVIKFILILLPAGFFILTDNQTIMIQSLFWIIVLDTILGTILAIKLKVFSSIGMGRFVQKMLPYSLILITVHLADLALTIGDNLLFITAGYLVLREVISNLEKGYMLNVPIPKKLMDLLGMEVEDIETMRLDWKKRSKK